MDLWFDFNFAAFFILALFPLLLGFKSLHIFRKNRLENFADSSVLSATVVERVDRIFWIQVFLFCIAWIFGTIALMQPKGNERYLSSGENNFSKTSISNGNIRQKHHLVIFLIDVSASMAIEDNIGNGSRLYAAKEIADDVISKLAGESVALFAFTSSTMQIVPFTMDYLFTRLMLGQLQVNEGETSGTNLKGAFASILKMDFTSSKEANKTLIVFTDGGDTSLYNLSGNELIEKVNEIAGTLKSREKFPTQTLVVGTGSLRGAEVPHVTYEGKPVISKLEVPLLRKISSMGGGEFWMTNETPTTEIANEIVLSLQKNTSYIDSSIAANFLGENEKAYAYEPYYQYPLGISIIALAGCLLLPTTSKRAKKTGSKQLLKAVVILSLCELQAYSQNIQNISTEDLYIPSAYFDAGDYSLAAIGYQNQYFEFLDPWEKAVLLYDAGTAFLANQEYTKALNKFEEARTFNIRHPLFRKNLLVNEALAELLKFKKLSAEVKNNPEATFENYSDIFSLYREVLAAINKAEKASCELDMTMGEEKCVSSIVVVKMRNFAKTSYAGFLENYLKFNSRHITLPELLSLKNLEGESAQSALERLLVGYSLMLIEEPVNLKSLEAIEKAEEVIEKLIVASLGVGKEVYQKAEHLLFLAKEALKEQKLNSARFFAEGSYFYLYKIAKVLSGPQERMSAKGILEYTIRQQELSLLMTRIWQQMEEEKNLSEEDQVMAADALHGIQSSILETAHVVFKAAIAQQKTDSSKGGACECKPWDEVIPLFQKGYDKAREAKDVLKDKKITSNGVIHIANFQESALKEWREAFQKLKIKAENRKLEASPSETSAISSTESKEPVVKASETKAFKEVLKYIQAMESEDKSKPAIVIFKGSDVDRPW